MNHALNIENTVVTVRSNSRKPHGKTNIIVFVMVFFVAVAAMQTLQLGHMLSEAKSIDNDINGLRTEQKVLRERYSFYDNNLSYYLDD